MKEIDWTLSTSTIIWLSLIVVVAIGSRLYIGYSRKKNKLISQRRLIESLPQFISTLGVLGTFWGITEGLLGFDSKNLDGSIPVLLDGMKTAFSTSLAGMIGSMLLSGVVNTLYDKEDGGVSDINIAAGEIVKAVQKMSEENQATLKTLQKALNDKSQEQAEAQNNFYHTTSEILSTLSEHCSNQAKDTAEIKQEVKRFNDNLHNEVVGIKKKMEETNQLLGEKFAEFSDLLQKSNTEALVEVMKNVTEEFQKQMNSLIDKLIKENFEQLNQSVERLNTWQIENKEMISSLTEQYKQMTSEFENTSTTLTKVGEDTKLLVSDGSKLRQLIDMLNKVIIEDERFISVTENLQEACSLTKDNMEKFDESTNHLNEWVKKQRNFVDGVQELINRLDKFVKVRDYGEQIKEINDEFYTRLNSTFAELDACIQAMIKAYNNKR